MKQSPHIIKKYSNRRLYDTITSSYITLETLRDMVVKEEDFQVVDAKTGEDLSHATLVQMIFDMEMKGYNLFPASFLKQMIRLYEQGNYSMFAPFLEKLSTLSETQMKHWNELQAGWTNASELSSMDALALMAEKQQKIFFDAISFFTSPQEENKPSHSVSTPKKS